VLQSCIRSARVNRARGCGHNQDEMASAMTACEEERAPAAKAGAAMSTEMRRADNAARNRSVCILSRKPLDNITRVTRMAKALSDAGWRVVVVSLGAPVAELRDMCAQVEYLEVAPRPFVFRLTGEINRRLSRRRNRRARRQARQAQRTRRGGMRAIMLRFGGAVITPLGQQALRCWRLIVAVPCAVMLRKPDRGFAATWRELAGQETTRTLALFLAALQQPASSRGFAAAADAAVRHYRFDVVQAHDNYALTAAARLARRDKARLIYDAVELTEHRMETNFSWFERLIERRQRRAEAAIFRRADAVTTVSDGLADWYARHYRMPRPVVVRNCRYFWNYHADGRLRADIGAGPATRLVIWFGRIYPQQGIELLIDAVPRLHPDIDIAVVAWALPRWRRYLEEILPGRAAALGVAHRVHFLPPRDPNDLIPYASGADIGIIPRPSDQPNNFYSMPNKFMEMVMARLPLAVSRLGDIVDLVHRFDIGRVFDERDAAEIARVIDSMLDPGTYRQLKANVMRAAGAMTWENESQAYVSLVAALTPAPPVAGENPGTLHPPSARGGDASLAAAGLPLPSGEPR
jgi:glycosyltransferase involved in cell wall biosynthesis